MVKLCILPCRRHITVMVRGRSELLTIVIVFSIVLNLLHVQPSTASRTNIYEERQPVASLQLETQKLPSPHEMRSLIGSSPPKCVKRCGSCSPCMSTLVPIHRNVGNTPFTQQKVEAEYYPVAWRCQCRGKIY